MILSDLKLNETGQYTMARKKDDMVKECLLAIEKHKLVFIEDVVAYVSFCKATFYNNGLHEIDSIKEALTKNKIEIKNGLRAKWYKGDNPTAQIALYKLIGSDEEAERLNGSKQKIEHSGEITLTEEQRKQKIEQLRKRLGIKPE